MVRAFVLFLYAFRQLFPPDALVPYYRISLVLYL